MGYFIKRAFARFNRNVVCSFLFYLLTLEFLSNMIICFPIGYYTGYFLTLCSIYKQARNQLGTPGGRRVFREGPKFFELCPIFLDCVQHIFPEGRKNF